jgi:fatty acid-binding protein DegV
MNRALSMIGEILQIKPILKMYDGISTAERVRTHRAAFTRLTEMLHTYSPFEKLAFLHSNALDQAHTLQEKMKHLIPESGALFGVVNPVLGTHIGPGVVGFAGVTKE